MAKKQFCQSCGMPLDKDPKGGGTEADGSKNAKYCSYCYVDGKFTQPDVKTGKEMQQFCKKLMRQQGHSAVTAWLFTLSIPSLERWKTATK